MNRGQWALLGVGATVILAAGLMVGAVNLPGRALIDAFTCAGGADATLVRNLRMPRVILAFLVGGTLGLSGAALQALVRNPLADPYLVGLSGGAGLMIRQPWPVKRLKATTTVCWSSTAS